MKQSTNAAASRLQRDNAMALESFNAYHSYLKSIELLNDAERGRLFTACLQYSMTGEVPDLRGNERFVFPMMKEQIDRDKAKYDAKCKANKSNIKSRWDKDTYERIPSNTTVYDRNDSYTKNTKDKDKDKDKDKTGDKARTTRFTPPAVEEVRAYCLERKNSVDAERFVNYYASNGWIVGKTKMKDWKAAVRTWERRDANGGYRSARENQPADKRTWDLDIIEL